MLNQNDLALYHAYRLVRIRRSLACTQAEFAELFRCPLKTYQRWEQAGCKPYIFDLINRAYPTFQAQLDIPDGPVHVSDFQAGFDATYGDVEPEQDEPEQVEPEQVDLFGLDASRVLDYPWDTDFWIV